VNALAGWWDDYFWGSVVIAQIFVVSFLLTILFGLIGAAAKLSQNRIAKSLASGYTVVFRGTPEILVILLLYFGSAITLTGIAQFFDPSIRYVDIPPFWAGSFAIALIVGSYATETFRGAFLGVSQGSIEAAQALGLAPLQVFIYVRIPEMWRLALPPLGNHALSLIKDTALVSIIGMNETLFVAKQAIGSTGKPFTMYIVVGLIYLAFSTVITLSFMGLEKVANRHMVKAR
jgi:polar amino acid transport system permease protein